LQKIQREFKFLLIPQKGGKISFKIKKNNLLFLKVTVKCSTIYRIKVLFSPFLYKLLFIDQSNPNQPSNLFGAQPQNPGPNPLFGNNPQPNPPRNFSLSILTSFKFKFRARCRSLRRPIKSWWSRPIKYWWRQRFF